MTKRGWRAKLLRTVATLAVGGSVFQLSGCDPNVRTTLLGGLQTTSQTLATSLISAFFLSIAPDNADGTLTTT